MRILNLRLERYGFFEGRELAFRDDAQLHVVLGANEAGKSTALRAIGDLLFGFPNATSFDFLHDQTSLRIGADLLLGDGAALSLRRRKGRLKTLLDANDKPLAEDLLAPVVGALTRDVFDAEFGLNSESLRKGGRDLLGAGGRLAETLAAASSRLAALSHLRKRLDEDADDLFGARRVAAKPYYVAYDRYLEAEKELRDCVVTRDALADAKTAVEEAKKKCAELTSAHDANGRELAKLERALRTRGKLQRLDILRGEMNGLADAPQIEDAALSTWREALEETARIDAALAEHRATQAADAQIVAALHINSTLLSCGARIDELRKTIGAVRQAEKDLPSRRAEARGARDELDAAARRLGLSAHETLLARQPTDAALARVEDLADRLSEAERRLAEAKDALEAAKVEAQTLDSAGARQAGLCDPAPFAQRFEIFDDIPADADRLRRERLAQHAARRRLQEEAERLDPFAGEPDDLARLPLPDAASIEAMRRRFEEGDAEDKRAGAEMQAAQLALAAIERDIVALAQDDVATFDDLRAARERRDQVFRRLGEALEGEAAPRRDAYENLGVASQKLDSTTDLLLNGAERAALFQSACERRTEQQQAYEKLRAAQDERVAHWRAAQADWRALWARSVADPKNPAQMADWRKRVDEILRQRERLDGAALETAALEQKLQGQRAALMRLIEEMGEDVGVEAPIESLHKAARARIERLQAGWRDVCAAAAKRESALASLARAERAAAKAEAARAEVLSAWPQALTAIGLAGPATIAEAKAALKVWRDAPLFQDRLKTAQHRIDTMQINIEAFDAEVGALVETAARDLAEVSRREALDILSERLAETRAQHQQREALRKAAQSRDVARIKHETLRAAAQERLAAGRAALGVATGEDIAPMLARAERRGACLAEIETASRDLAESSDNFDEATLRAEQCDLQPDLLAGAIERVKAENAQIFADLQSAAAGRHEAERAYAVLEAGRDAASASAARVEAGAELVAVASRWLLRASAARLAARAIERHRAAAQDPLIARASNLFAIATDGGFAGLCVDYDEEDEPALKGLRADGAKVPVSGLSEGARDQLFLALRLALLELRGGEPLPFIGDDLLASFDEARTARALGLLAEFGATRQAILFTHHRHVAEIARSLSGVRADVIAL